ncbi:hypothetical protein [Rhodococcus marinonascens]|uniref:hypothetical protein n=1 Tax=Rhodococcus marinonascens TaxID=38311 RepID=UPI00093215F2|nr:hypothetical protein [Rhodococcus marinonascens]
MKTNLSRYDQHLPEHQRIADLVDAMEERVAAEREAKGIAGNQSDRAAVEKVEPADQAPA